MGQELYIEPTCYFADKSGSGSRGVIPTFFSPVGVEWLSNSRALLQKIFRKLTIPVLLQFIQIRKMKEPRFSARL